MCESHRIRTAFSCFHTKVCGLEKPSRIGNAEIRFPPLSSASHDKIPCVALHNAENQGTTSGCKKAFVRENILGVS